MTATPSRVAIAAAQRSDAGALIRVNRESIDLHAPWVEPFVDQDGFDRWFAELDGARRASFVARLASAGSVVGVFNLSEIVRGAFRSAYLGFYVAKAWSGRGLMTEALRLVERSAFDVMGLHRLEANIQPENTASIALVRRAGFRREGYSPRYLRVGGAWRDHERWALLEDDLPGP